MEKPSLAFLQSLDKVGLVKAGKLGVSTYIELALLLPHHYEDHSLQNAPSLGSNQTIDATIESVVRMPNSIKITMYAHNFGFSMEAVMFRPKPYMLRQFLVNERYYMYGKIECSRGHCSMLQPLKVTQVGGIVPKYKTTLRNDVMQRFIMKHVTLENLQSEGLNEKMTTNLLKLHFLEKLSDVYSDDNYHVEILKALKYSEVYNYMKKLQHKRRYFKANAQLTNRWQEWSTTLPFTLTPEQISALESVSSDLSSKNAAKRMIVGDVGSGKTMVILGAVVMAKGFCSILMAPTTILASQLYKEAKKFLPDLNITLVTNTTKKEDLSSYDFIIGTHALLYRELPKTALVMVDEQHRFGTAQRHQLEKMLSESKTHPHYLQFSATPIPRTQAMIDSAQIDVSLITKTPFKKDITTKCIEKDDFANLLEHIEQEVSQNHQVLLVYPLVEESEALNYQSISEARAFWEKRFDKVYVTHGKDKEKEQVIETFKNEGNILLATTVVEVGISLPRLTTIVIVGAERLGLSTLHQLRGRVSRNGLKGYCYLFSHNKKSERLESFTKTDNGFDIANLDLKYRQSGDLLTGKKQSGKRFIWIDMAEDKDIVQEVVNDLSLGAK